MSQSVSSVREFIGHIFIFIFMMILLVGILTLYYFSTGWENTAGKSLPFLNLSAQGGLFRWFCALIWGGITFQILSITRFFRSIKKEKGALWFWRFVALLTGLMSCNAVCALFPALLEGGESLSENEAAVGFSLVETELIPIGVLFFAFLAAIALYSSGKQVGLIRRWIIKAFFAVTVFSLCGSVLCHYCIPTSLSSDNPVASSKASRSQETQSEDGEGESAVEDEYIRTVAYDEEKGAESSSDQQKEKSLESDSEASLTQLEDIFGMERSVEDLFGMTEPIEKKFGIDQPIEEKIENHGIRLNLNRSREMIRYGSFGLFLGLLYLAVALLGHFLWAELESQKRSVRKTQLNSFKKQLREHRRLQKEYQKLRVVLIKNDISVSS